MHNLLHFLALVIDELMHPEMIFRLEYRLNTIFKTFQ